VVRTNTNKKHPFSRFSTGNLQTLRDDPKKQGLNVRDELIKWYNAHYSANVMKLCVLGKGSSAFATIMAIDHFLFSEYLQIN